MVNSKERRDSKLKLEDHKVKKNIEVEKNKLKSLVQNLMESFLQGRRESDTAEKEDIIDLKELRKYSRRASVAMKKNDIEHRRILLKLSELDGSFKNINPRHTLTEGVDKRSPADNNIKRTFSKFEYNFSKNENEEVDNKNSFNRLLTKLTSPQLIPQPLNVLNNEIFTLDKDQLLQKINEKNLQKNKKTLLKFNRKELFGDNLSMNEFNLDDDSMNKTIKVSIDDTRTLKKTKKLDDSMSSQDDEEYSNLKESSFYINHNGLFKNYWDSLIVLCTLYTIIAAPYMLAFVDDEPYYLIILECIIDIIYLADMVINFFVPFMNHEEEMVLNLKAITKNYLFGWFIIDLLASIPGSIIVLIMNSESESYTINGFSSFNKAARLARVYRFFKFSKILKAMKVSSGHYTKHSHVNNLQKLSGVDTLGSKTKRLFYFLINFILVSHIITCFWVFIGKNSNPNWIVLAQLTDSNDNYLYLSSLYFHWTTIFTIGYGDIISTNSDERLYNCLLLIVGVVIYSYTVSQLGNIVSTKDNITNKHLKNIEVLNVLKMKHNISEIFYNKIYRYLNHNFKFNKNERYGFIKELPPKVRNALLFDMYKEVVNNFAFFSYTKNSDFIARVLFTMKPSRIYKREYVVVEGQYLEEILFVRKGFLSVHLGVKYNEYRLMDIKRNEHFGDILALSNQRSPVGIKAGSRIVDLLVVSKEDFMEISKEFADAMEDIFLVSSYNFSSLLEIIEVKKIHIKENNRLMESSDRLKTRSFSHLFKENRNLIPFFQPQDNKIDEVTYTRENDTHIQAQDSCLSKINIFPDSPVKLNSEGQKESQHLYHTVPTQNPMNMFNFNLYIQNNSFMQNEKKPNDPSYINYASNHTYNNSTKTDHIEDNKIKDIMTVFHDSELKSTPRSQADSYSSDQEENGDEEYDNFDAEKPIEKSYQTKLSKVNIPTRRQSAYFPLNKRFDLHHETPRPPKRFLSIKNPQAVKSTAIRDVKKNDTLVSKTSSGKSVNANISQKLQNASKEKFRKSSMLVNNITNNLKQTEQVESNPHEFFINEFKELLYNQIENEVVEQEKKVISIFMKIYNKKDSKK
jgi:CRP-like cAMP-binding protein